MIEALGGLVRRISTLVYGDRAQAAEIQALTESTYAFFKTHGIEATSHMDRQSGYPYQQLAYSFPDTTHAHPHQAVLQEQSAYFGYETMVELWVPKDKAQDVDTKYCVKFATLNMVSQSPVFLTYGSVTQIKEHLSVEKPTTNIPQVKAILSQITTHLTSSFDLPPAA